MVEAETHPLILERLQNNLSAKQDTLCSKVDTLIAQNRNMIQVLTKLTEQPEFEPLKAFIEMYEDVNSELKHLDPHDSSSLFAIEALAKTSRCILEALAQFYRIIQLKQPACAAEAKSNVAV